MALDDEIKNKAIDQLDYLKSIKLLYNARITEFEKDRDEVIPKWSQVFSSKGLDTLTKEEFELFLSFNENRHWSNLQRTKGYYLGDFPHFIKSLHFLIDDRIPIEERINSIKDKKSEYYLKGFSYATFSAVLLIHDMHQYPVLNGTVEGALAMLGIAKSIRSFGSTVGERYHNFTELAEFLSKELDIDYWLLDSLWWNFGKLRSDKMSDETFVKIRYNPGQNKWHDDENSFHYSNISNFRSIQGGTKFILETKKDGKWYFTKYGDFDRVEELEKTKKKEFRAFYGENKILNETKNTYKEKMVEESGHINDNAYNQTSIWKLSKNLYYEILFNITGNDEFQEEIEEIKEIDETKVDDIQNIDGLIKQFHIDLTNLGFIYNENFIKRYVISLVTKPFVILTGLSGSGKTKLAQLFAEWIGCNFEIDNPDALLLPVGADWTSNENIVGYANALDPTKYEKTKTLELILRARNNSNKPYFLILDEMNLSHVEKYFSDFLSAIESGKRIPLHSHRENGKHAIIEGVPSSIALPKNIFVVGTVNIDETTYMFSPKVLDRANTIEFRVDENMMKSFLSEREINIHETEIQDSGNKYSEYLVKLAKEETGEIESITEVENEFLLLFRILSKNYFEFGFRTMYEILRFIKFYEDTSEEIDLDHVIDIQIMQKILPKLHGSRRSISSTLIALGIFCLKREELGLSDNENIFFAENTIEPYEVNQIDNIRFPISYNKLKRMYNRLNDLGYVSFPEA